MTEQQAGVQPTVDQAWNAVMNAVRSVAKSDWNESQQFAFRGVDAVVNAVGPALREHGVAVIPRKVRQVSAMEYETSRRTRMVNRVVRVQWEIRGPGGDTIRAETLGEAADSGDKGVTKACSVAYRVLLLQALAIPTGERDPDADSHERATSSTREGAVAAAAAQKERDEIDAANDVRGEMLSALEPYGWTGEKLIERFRADYRADLLSVKDLVLLRKFTEILVAEAKAEDAGSGDGA